MSWGRQPKRGGSWINNPRNCRSATRNNNNARFDNNNNGFRVVVCLPPSTLHPSELTDGNLLGVRRRVQTCSRDVGPWPDIQKANRAGHFGSGYTKSNDSAQPRRLAPLMPITIHRGTTTQPGYREALSADVNIPMLFIPSGSFTMGSPATEPQRQTDEGPQHLVTLSAFCMGQFPITQAQWRIVAGWPQVNQDINLNPSTSKSPNNPVDSVSWNDANEFCARLRRHTGRHYSLPSEAQWEYACRAGTQTPFHFGDTLTPELAKYNWSEIYGDTAVEKQEQKHGTSPVGSFSANAWGLHDMHGNVWEWCLDDWHSSYKGAPIDGSPWINKTSKTDVAKVLRGGSWIDIPRNGRSASRSGFNARFDYLNGGFRVVVCLPPRTL
jgi:formylglycine-generating enzyme required for sulfatase activity